MPRQIAGLLVREAETFVEGKRVPLTPMQQRILFALSRNGSASHGALKMLTRDGALSIKSHITHLRHALAPHGVRVANIWGQGYRLEATTRPSRPSTLTINKAGATNGH